MFGSFLILSVNMKSETDIQAMDAASQAAYKTAQANTVQGPYIGLALALVALAALMALFRLPVITGTTKDPKSVAKPSGDLPSAWEYRHLVLGAVGIFCYVGAEVAIGSYLVNFIGLSDVRGLEPAEAAKYVSLYWGGAMVGRFIGAAVMRKVRPGKVLAFNALCAVMLVLSQ